jgi:hypothetical protein
MDRVRLPPATLAVVIARLLSSSSAFSTVGAKERAMARLAASHDRH